MATEFREQFDKNLRDAGGALEDSGYEITAYTVSLWADDDYHETTVRSTPVEALDAFLDDLTSETLLRPYMTGSELREVITGDTPGDQYDPLRIVYRSVRGGISIEDPEADVEYADHVPGFGTFIDYIPEYPDDRFEVGTEETLPPYTKEDAEDRVDHIVTVLEDAEFTAEKDMVE